jgi:hypothetical protein
MSFIELNRVEFFVQNEEKNTTNNEKKKKYNNNSIINKLTLDELIITILIRIAFPKIIPNKA